MYCKLTTPPGPTSTNQAPMALPRAHWGPLAVLDWLTPAFRIWFSWCWRQEQPAGFWQSALLEAPHLLWMSALAFGHGVRGFVDAVLFPTIA